VRFSSRLHSLALALGSIAVMSAALLLAAAPAGAFISGEFGLQQRKPVWVRHGPLQYHSGPVIHASDSYAIYWDPLELYNSQWMRLIDQYFRNVGAGSGSPGNIFALNAQYGETGYGTGPAASEKAKEAHAANQSTFRGAYTDTESYPITENCSQHPEDMFPAVACLTDTQIRTMLTKLIKSGKLPGATGTVPGAVSTPVYYVLTPPGVTVCTEKSSSPNTCSNSTNLEIEAQEIKEAKITHPAETGICGYHSWAELEPKTPIVYAVQPWVAGDAGLFSESTGASADVLACQDNSLLEEPNQQGYNPFAFYGGGLADVVVGDLANEQSNILVDPLLSGWYQNASAAEGGSPEQGDMCQFNFGPPPQTPPKTQPKTNAANLSNEEIGSGSYYAHWAFNSSGFITGKDTAGCWQGVSLLPHITAPNPVNVGDVVGLDANESGITLDAAPLGLRVQKEETRLAKEVLTIGDEVAALGVEINKLGAEETKLGKEETKLGTELTTLGAKEEALAQEEKELKEERKNAKEATLKEEEEFTAKEKRLADEEKKVSEEKAAAEGKLKADEKEKRADHEQKLVDEEDRTIVEGDKPLAKEEEKLAKEDKLIKEREPLIAPIYKWDFGYQENGKEVTEEGEEKASVFHTFPCAKTYTVELTVVDGGGNETGLPAGVTKEITVEGKPCEESSSGSGSETGGGSTPTPGTSTPGTSTPGSTTPGSTVKTPGPAPVASAAAVPSSLRKTTKKGLVVSYSVNQQVAGHFEVLLAASIAHRLGLHSPLATGLPAGTLPQVVIGKAILITTRGGRGALKIQFGKITGKRLRRLGRVSLMLRLNVRNSSGGTTTVLSTFTLR
jgi:hypothetical protein